VLVLRPAADRGNRAMKRPPVWVPGITMCSQQGCTLPAWRDSTLCVNHLGLKIGKKTR
jgi:hypothetical protein